MLEMILQAAIRPVKEQLSLFPHLLPKNAISTMYQRVEDSFTRKTEQDEEAITLGDCWTGALLTGLNEAPAGPQVGIIDWEFASVGRGVNGDVAQLLAHLHLLEIAAGLQGQTDSLAAIDALLQGLTAEYRRRSQALNHCWLANSVSVAPGPHSLTARLMRSAFLALGAEIIDNAFWKDWVCDSEGCCSQRYQGKQHCKLIQKMVQTGCWYLYHAEEDEVKFVSNENWRAI